MEKRKTEYESSVMKYLESFRQRLVYPGQTKPDRAEQAIRDLYLRVKNKQPRLVLWCSSPYQMAVLPPLFASVLETSNWKALSAKLNRHSPGSTAWESAWRREWNRLKADLEPLFTSVLEHPREYFVAPSVRDTASARLEELLHDALRDGKLDRDLIATGPDKYAPENYRRIKFDRDFHRFAIIVQNCAEQIAGLPMRAGLPQGEQNPEWDSQIENFTIAARGVTLGVFLGAWDSRLLTKLVPAAEKIMPHSGRANREAALRVKEMFRETEQLAQQRINWYRRLPPVTPVLNQSEVHDWSEEWGKKWDTRMNGKSKLDQIRGVVQTGIEGYDGFTRMVREHIGLRNQSTVWFPHSDWIPFTFACCFIDPEFFGELKQDIDILAALGHGACGYLFLSRVCFVCEAPISYNTNALGRPHHDSGPAASWTDGFKVYAWRGIPVESRTIERKHHLTLQRIHAERNAELKRVMIDIYGESRYLMDAGARVVHADEFGTLYRADIEHEEALVMVKVRNSTPEADGTYKHYFLRVPPTMTRARQAIAWTFGLEESEYHPTHHS